jgi:RNA polymerase primary sigma factor
MRMRQIKLGTSITIKDTPSMEKYLLEISRIKRISPEEELVLSERIKQGCEKALHQLITANLRFVISVSKQYQFQGLPLIDLINEGNCGLVKAARRFDGSKGFKFISYAVWWIRQSILQALADHGRVVRVPLSKISTTQQVYKAQSHLEQQLEREATLEEIATWMGLHADEIKNCLQINLRHYRLDAPLAEEEDLQLADTIEDKGAERADLRLEGPVSLRTEIARSLGTLSKRQQYILCAYYGLDRAKALSLEEIGQELGVSRERIRQIKEKAISKLQHGHRSRQLQCFLGGT